MSQDLGTHERKTLDEFLGAIKPLLAGYKPARFSYMAIREGDGFVLTQGQLHLRGEPLSIPSGCFESQNVKAGSFSLLEANQTPQGIVDLLLSGKLQTPHGELQFPASQNQGGSPYSIFLNPFHAEGIQSQRRVRRPSSAGSPRRCLRAIATASPPATRARPSSARARAARAASRRRPRSRAALRYQPIAILWHQNPPKATSRSRSTPRR